MFKGFEDPLHIKSRLSIKSINRATFSQFWDMKENICKFMILYLEGLTFRDDF